MASVNGCKAQSAELFQQQTRKMSTSAALCLVVVTAKPASSINAPVSAGGGHHDGPIKAYKSYDGKPAPTEFQNDNFVTYAGLTLMKQEKTFDYYWTKAIGSLVW